MISEIIKDIKILGMLLHQTEQQITEAKELLKMAKEKHVEISELLNKHDSLQGGTGYISGYIFSSGSPFSSAYYEPNPAGSSAYFREPKTTDGRTW